MAEAIYNSARWKRLRLQKLREEPLCQTCRARGLLVPADSIDHRVPISAGGPPFPPTSGLTSFCRPCHSSKTAAEQAGKTMRGCGLDGQPIDPNHPWNVSDTTGGEEATDRDGRLKSATCKKNSISFPAKPLGIA